MSYSHNKRRKTIKRFKKDNEHDWYEQFRLYVSQIVKIKEGKVLGTLEDLKLKGVI